MLHDGVAHKQWKFPPQNEVGQQERVFRSLRMGIKQWSIRTDIPPSNCEACRVQIADTAVRLECLILNAGEAQFFRSADERRAIAGQMKLERTALGTFEQRRMQG